MKCRVDGYGRKRHTMLHLGNFVSWLTLKRCSTKSWWTRITAMFSDLYGETLQTNKFNIFK